MASDLDHEDLSDSEIELVDLSTERLGIIGTMKSSMIRIIERE